MILINSYLYISNATAAIPNEITLGVGLEKNQVHDHAWEKYLFFDVEDDGTGDWLPEVISMALPLVQGAKIDNKKMLIHCVYGQSRSVCVAIICLAKAENLSYEEARDIILSKHPDGLVYSGYEENIRRCLRNNSYVCNSADRDS